MIVSCPACATHYLHEREQAHLSGHCSQCDERFPLDAAERRYVLLPRTEQAGTDPLLTAGISATESLVDRPAPATETPFGLPDPMIPEGEHDDGFFGAAMEDDEALFGMDDVPTVEQTEPEAADPTEASPAARPDHPLREAAAVFLLAGLGAAAGYQGSMKFGFETLNAIGVGLGVGITFGWAWIRWAERKR